MTNDAALVCHTLGLGKSQIASLLGVTRAALYACQKGSGTLPPDAERRLHLLAGLVAQISTPVQRPLFHALVEHPLPGQSESILALLQREVWELDRLRVLLLDARRLTAERDRRLAADSPAAALSEAQREAIYLDNLIALGQG